MRHATFILFFLFIVMPLTELFILIKLAGAIGGWETFFIVVVTGVVGASLARAQGIACLQRIQAQLQRGRMPTDEMGSGLLILAASLLLVTPGVITDAVGFALLIPQTRRFVFKQTLRILKNHHKFVHFHVDNADVDFTPSRHRGSGSNTETIDIEAVPLDDDDDQDKL